jgi:hypothetical protein
MTTSFGIGETEKGAHHIIDVFVRWLREHRQAQRGLLIARGVRKFRRLIALVKQIKVVWGCDILQDCALLTSSNVFRESYETLNPASLSM